MQIQIAANNVVAKLIGADKELTGKIATLLSYEVEGAKFMGVENWSGRSSFYSRRSNTFPAGFLYLVYHELIRLGHTVSLIRNRHVEPLGPVSPIVDAFENDDPRYDFQLESLRAVEKHGRGIIQSATGSGKSKIARLIVARYRRMTLFLTTRGILMHQMAAGFKEAGFNCGMIGDGLWKPVKGVNCGMVQTFVANLKEPDLQLEVRELLEAAAAMDAKARKEGRPRPQMPPRSEIESYAKTQFDAKRAQYERYAKLLNMMEVVIGEEAHEAGGNSYYEILRHCRNASIRVALTATPFMRESAEDNMRLMAAFGPTLIRVSEEKLIDRGILATPSFKFHVSKPHPKLHKTSPWQRAYQLGYVENSNLHNDIVEEACRAAARGLPVMTLIQRTGHGKTLQKLMKAAGLRAEFIQGENDQDERKRALDRLASGKIDVLIGTTILDVGVDVPAVGLVQLAGGGKAEVALRQRIGRGMRFKKSGPNTCFITIYSVAANKHLKAHSELQRSIIEGTPGFAERILATGKDHDWDLFPEIRTLRANNAILATC